MGSMHVAIPEEFRAGCKPYPYAPCEHHNNATHYQPCPADIYPTNTCEHSCQSGYSVSYDNDKHFGATAYAVAKSVTAIQKEIMTNGPVEVSCNGGYPIQAWKFWVKHGVVSGGNYTSKAGCKPYPYAPCEHHNNATHYQPCPSDIYPTNTCEHSCQSGYSVSYDNDKHFGRFIYPAVYPELYPYIICPVV
ncbi:unnamed protein product [Nippostrongylus brasiliensis]|uniref:Cathepsin B (inferred by orthology to a human protein) n=1 Tax=Nippostrongylus brasiliensis TaxID=27835 RepID=A0A0N4XYL7_NIPBR|nr:unnamed protein product [Nippostrongylus brasiliensis]